MKKAWKDNNTLLREKEFSINLDKNEFDGNTDLEDLMKRKTWEAFHEENPDVSYEEFEAKYNKALENPPLQTILALKLGKFLQRFI